MQRTLRGGVTPKGVQIACTYPDPITNMESQWVPFFRQSHPRVPSGSLGCFYGRGTLSPIQGQYCSNSIRRNQTSFKCHHSVEHWVHKNCTGITINAYQRNPGWKCKYHTQSINPTAKHKKKLNLKILQININSIKNKIADLKQVTTEDNPDIITVQETNLKSKDKTPVLLGYTASRAGGRPDDRGLLTYIKQDIKFTNIAVNTPEKTELQITKLHLSTAQDLYIANTYIHPRTETIAIDDDKTENIFRQILRHDNTIIVGDVNAHSARWFSPMTDHRGDFIADIINDSNHLIINADTPTRRPFSRQDTPHQQPTSPDITAIPMRLFPHTT